MVRKVVRNWLSCSILPRLSVMVALAKEISPWRLGRGMGLPGGLGGGEGLVGEAEERVGAVAVIDDVIDVEVLDGGAVEVVVAAEEVEDADRGGEVLESDLSGLGVVEGELADLGGAEPAGAEVGDERFAAELAFEVGLDDVAPDLGGEDLGEECEADREHDEADREDVLPFLARDGEVRALDGIGEGDFVVHRRRF
jgi:hypothetical protein